MSDKNFSDGDGGWKSGYDNTVSDQGGFKSANFEGQDGDTSTTTSTRSWGSRLTGALTGLAFAFILLPAACWLLFWNEGRAVHTARSLTEGAGSVQSVPNDRVDAALEGRLVHVAGPLRIAGTVADPDFGVQAPNAAQLVRVVEMYQWRENTRSETRSRTGGSQETVTTYTYDRVWSDRALDSSRFHNPGGHNNPAMPVTGRTIVAEEGRIGAYRVGAPLLRQLHDAQPLALQAQPRSPVNRPMQRQGNNGIYLGNSPDSPQVGDLRISWRVVQPASASVIGKQQGDGFAAWQARAGDALLMMHTGEVPANQMFQEAQDANAVMTWILRAVGVVLVLVGFLLIFAPLAVLADVLPILGSIVGAGTFLLSLLLTMLVAPLVIGLAWLWYRPLIGIGVLAFGLVMAFLTSRMIAKRRAARAPSSFFAGMPGGRPS